MLEMKQTAVGGGEEVEQPFLILKGRLTADARVRAYRWGALRLIAIRLLIFIVALTVVEIGINLYFGLPAFDLASYFGGAVFWVVLGILVAAYAIELLWLRPVKLRKNMVEMYGNDPAWETEYAFYDRRFTYRFIGSKSSSDVSLDYADLKSLKLYRYYILLRTKTNNRMSLNRGELSPEDEQKLIDTLRARGGLQ